MLTDKIALVTGGTGALGSVVVARLVQEGATVYAASHEPAPKVTHGSTATMLTCNVTEESSVQRMFDAVVERSGRVDILVHTAGGYVAGNPVAKTSMEDWDRMMSLNLTGSFLCIREALRRMHGKPYGRIITISAMTGVVPVPGRAAYAISKAGAILLVTLAAKEVQSTITINTIAPSIIDTSANRASMPDADFATWVRPERIAEKIVWFCSPDATGVTGTTVQPADLV